MNHADIYFSRLFAAHLPRLIRLLCAAAAAPEKKVLQGLENLKSLADLSAYVLEILESGNMKQQHWLLDVIVSRDAHQEGILEGVRVHVACPRQKVYFSISLEGRLLQVESAVFLISADPAGKNGLAKQAPDVIKNMPPHMKRVLRSVLQSDQLKACRDAAAAADIVSRLSRESGGQMLDPGVAGRIRPALDYLEALRGVPESDVNHLGMNWSLQGEFASPERQAVFLTHDLPETAESLAVQLLRSHQQPEVVKGVSFMMPLGGEDMLEVMVEEMGMTLDMAGLTFELPDYAEGEVAGLKGLDAETRAALFRALEALAPLAGGQAARKCREAMLVLSLLEETATM